ncbi:chorismate lyase [Marinobacter halodurans]|uniref:Probable chorismate pyruvate-lyase n=1 Tax=Marinobacter halodurans TaxID=2528979 RepID=A0ABY1ZPM4_9GAMM|nr:chorismate lyase [Marinobacter halodurans]TBW58802.1 chorismate lyase [Marinobacter halodurans]
MPSRDSDISARPSGAMALPRVPTARWYPGVAAAQLIRPQPIGDALYWLELEGSLTRALQLRCRERFHVEVLREGYARPTLEEARTLHIPSRQLAWIREVQLCGDGQPWVMARTVIPLATLRGRGRRLRHLGGRPLGAFLFSQRRWQRGPFQIGLTRQPAPGQPAVGRRSRFHRGSDALLVGEYFLPRLLQGNNSHCSR